MDKIEITGTALQVSRDGPALLDKDGAEVKDQGGAAVLTGTTWTFATLADAAKQRAEFPAIDADQGAKAALDAAVRKK